ncbi:IS256 family transposase [Kiritimatiellaeota bacterium B1221]|nr:IS256 family transposase [Kiritimatiellaeota bacterium B1221]
MDKHIDLNTILQAEATQAATLLSTHVRQCARAAILNIIQEEVDLLCGPSHHPNNESAFFRAGSAPSSIYIEGKRQAVSRPRVRERTEDGSQEVTIKTLQAARDPHEWEDMVHRAILCGVSGRDQARLQAHELKGMTKSNISRLWAQRAGELIREMNETDLSDFRMIALMLDGFSLSHELHVIVALGIDMEGHKRVLGYTVGASESYEVSKDLLSSLVRRGLTAATGTPLVILDGAEALRKAVLEFWPDAPVQRCLVHKERNLRGYLSRKHHGRLRLFFSELRKAQGEEAALEILKKMEDWIGGINAQALASLQEARGDMIAWFRLGGPATLNQTFLSTNHIENSMRNLRKHLGRVKRWRPETDMASRWVASGLWIAQRGFRRVRGYRDLPVLAEKLNARHAACQEET